MATDGARGSDGENVIALLPWRIAVRRAFARKQAHQVLDRKDADEAIRALSEVEAYHLVKELGLEDSLPVLSALEPHQTRALFDLDVWHDGRPDLEDTLVWLHAFRESDFEALHRAARSIDPELLALLFRRRLLIATVSPDDDPEKTGAPIPDWAIDPPESILPLVETADRRFIVAARAIDEEEELDEGHRPIDEESRKAILALVDALYRDADFDFVAAALKTAQDDLSSALEDDARRFREARLEDLGFPSLERALELYAPIDPQRVLEISEARLPVADLHLPAVYAERFAKGLFQEVLSAIESADEIRRIEGELVALSNAAAVADRIEPGNAEALIEVLERARAYIELALGWQVEPDALIDVGVERLLHHSVRTLFRIGYALTLQLAQRAERLVRGRAFALGSEPLALLREEDRQVFTALKGKRPRFAVVLEGEGSERTRPFASARDLALTGARLDVLEALAEASRALDLAATNQAITGEVDPPEPFERHADMLLATGAANALLGRGFALEPIDEAGLGTLRELLTPKTASAQDTRGAIADAYEKRAGSPLAPLLLSRIESSLIALTESLSAIDRRGKVDARFVGVVVRRIS
jgi:hypothetical protein